jgi:hypothetical protein
VTTFNPTGGLVDLTVPAGEADALSSFVSPVPGFSPSGFPTCTADLEARVVTCSGLVSGTGYTVTDGGAHASATADGSGAVSVPLAVHLGDSLTLSNAARMLTTLHVANLKVAITGEQTVLAGGTCQAGDYFGGPLTDAPTNGSAGAPSAVAGGAALTGEICPTSGNAVGLPSSGIAQTDDASGGQTQTEVPDVQDTSPIEGETMLGKFVALAESGLPGPNNSVVPTDATSTIALSIARAAGGSPVFSTHNVDTTNGVFVVGVKAGTYRATWTLSNASGDTRTVTTRFVELTAPQGRKRPHGPKPSVKCVLEPHGKIKCTVTFLKARSTKGMLRMRVSRGTHLVALGHARVKRGKATVTLRERRRVTHGAWKITLVLAQSHHAASTTTMSMRMR